MADLMLMKEAAKIWGCPRGRWPVFAKRENLKAQKKAAATGSSPLLGKSQLITASNPVWIKKQKDTCLPLAIGISDYRLVSTEYYYIDKTMLIKDFLDERSVVSLFTRARRFDKTLILKIVKSDASFSGNYMCKVALPNKEIVFYKIQI